MRFAVFDAVPSWLKTSIGAQSARLLLDKPMLRGYRGFSYKSRGSVNLVDTGFMINSVMQIGFSGMRNAYAGMVQSSQQIASAATQEYGASMPDIVDNMISLKKNQQLFDASAKVVETSDQMLGTLLDIRA